MLNIRRNVIFSFIEISTNTLLTFISYRLVLRLGGFELLGIWSALLAWIGLSRLGDFGLGGAATRFVAALDVRSDRERICRYIDTAIISNAVLISALTFLSYLAVSHWLVLAVGAANVAVAQPALPWLMAAVIATNLCLIITSSLFSLHLGYIRSIIMISGNVLQLGLVVWLVPRYGLPGFAGAQIIQYSFAGVVAWIAICVQLGKLRLPFAFRWVVLREMLNVSMMLQAANIANGLFEPLSKVMVSHFGGMQMQGLFEAAYKTVWTARNISSNTATAVIPAITRYVQTDIPAAQRLYFQTRRNIVVSMALILGGVVVASPVISLLWFKALNVRFVEFVALLAIGCAFGGWCTPAYNLGQATGKLKGVVITMVASDVLLLAGGLGFGLAGMPFMIVVATTAGMILTSVMVIRFNEPLIGLRGASFGGLFGARAR